MTRPRAPRTLCIPVRRDHDVANFAEADHAARSGDARDSRQQGGGGVRGDEHHAPAHVALAVRQGSGRLRLRADRSRRAHHRASPRYRLQPVRRSGRHAHDPAVRRPRTRRHNPHQRSLSLGFAVDAPSRPQPRRAVLLRGPPGLLRVDVHPFDRRRRRPAGQHEPVLPRDLPGRDPDPAGQAHGPRGAERRRRQPAQGQLPHSRRQLGRHHRHAGGPCGSASSGSMG